MRMLHSVRLPKSAPTRTGPISGAAKPVGRFGFHFMEMCVVMCLGGGLLIAVFFGELAAVFGFGDLRQQFRPCPHSSPPSSSAGRWLRGCGSGGWTGNPPWRWPAPRSRLGSC